MKEFRKRYWYEVALCASFVQLIYSPIAYTADIGGEDRPEVSFKSNEWTELAAKISANADTDTYTINFNNIAIIELIRFASKITDLNFVFEEADLQFTVTVVSEEPVSAKSLMAALSQVLRTHDLVLLEENGNVLITKSTTVNQIAPIVSSDLPDSHAGNAALVTRVFRLKNANVNTIAGIIRPMTSQGALIEVSVETRQLIVTDITTNVDQIASLLMSLDAPHTSLDVETYVVKNIAPTDLITLTQQILSPFTEGNPLIFVAQAETNSIYIVSTPYLIERAMTVMEDLDIPTKPVLIGKPDFGERRIYLQDMNRSPDQTRGRAYANRTAAPKRRRSSLSSGNGHPECEKVKSAGSLMFVADRIRRQRSKTSSPHSIPLRKDLLHLQNPARAETQIAQF